LFGWPLFPPVSFDKVRRSGLFNHLNRL